MMQPEHIALRLHWASKAGLRRPPLHQYARVSPEIQAQRIEAHHYTSHFFLFRNQQPSTYEVWTLRFHVSYVSSLGLPRHDGSIQKLDPKWVPERAKHSGRKIWHEMKGPWRLSPIEHNPKITNLFSRRAFLVTPRWWRSTWRFPITDHSWNVDIHARKSKRGRRANQVKSNNSRQISQVK